MKITKRIQKNSIYKYIRYFFIYAFFGWLLETLYSVYALGYFTKRGFLTGPICPIYGFSALILIVFFKNYKKNSIKLFVYAGIVFSVFEYLASFFLEAVYKIKCWDYTNEFFNLNGRISIFFTVVWGIIAILFINKIHPFIEKHINKLSNEMPQILQTILLYSTIAVFLFDEITTSIGHILLISLY